MSFRVPTLDQPDCSICFNYDLITDGLPTLNELMMLKYTEKGEEKKICIIKEASHRWKDVASLICDNPRRVRELEDEHPGRPHDCLQQTLIDDFIIKKPADFSHNWSGLIELLDNVDLEELAERVKYALSCIGSSPTSGGMCVSNNTSCHVHVCVC